MTSTELHGKLQYVLARISSDCDSSSAFVKWSASPETSNLPVDALAVEIARLYVDGRIDFPTASAALSSVMMWCDFEAPATFWEFYLAFEDLEIDEDSGPAGLKLIGKVLDSYERAKLLK